MEYSELSGAMDVLIVLVAFISHALTAWLFHSVGYRRGVVTTDREHAQVIKSAIEDRKR